MKPQVTTSHDGAERQVSARLMAGCKSDQKLAAIITPAANPSMEFNILRFVFLKKITVAEPSAVTNHVPNVAIRAIHTGFNTMFLPPSIVI